jgi:hypothetical protein
MSFSNLIHVFVFDGLGLWLLAFPRSVIRVYAWLRRGEFKRPSPTAIRLLGLAWIAVMVAVALPPLKR